MTYTITHRQGTYYGEADMMDIIEAHTEDGQLAAELYITLTHRMIANIETKPNFQREGLATALVQYAVDNDIEVYHAPVEFRTAEGDAFAQACDIIDELEMDDELATEYGYEIAA
ncbi:hypothetical protein [uncultured Corynebacterium sp.]|uniref:hypothetical protein n=1 Tax=uncultured Corynebacterium sp. TaxID=159447 RepID=UPI0025937175|nr:hypothetical protein [uncultured Corynebacterium sp.]